MKYPSKLNEIQKVVVPLIKYVPLNQAKKVIPDILFDNAATKLINKYGEAIIADLITVAEKNGNLAKTTGIAKDENNVRWLEEGASSWGWTHIKSPQRWQQITDKFGPKTRANSLKHRRSLSPKKQWSFC